MLSIMKSQNPSRSISEDDYSRYSAAGQVILILKNMQFQKGGALVIVGCIKKDREQPL